ncbi:MAG: hypothetical protein MJZ53_02780 [Paludibacteraceae bacterium]|nr:hypothetical protein [Paludibacteraceae bacterium]
MTLKQKQIIRYTVPAALWLLVGVGLFCFYRFCPYPRWEGALTIFLIPLIFWKANRRRGAWAKEICSSVICLGIASYWLPSIVFLTPLVWAYVAHWRFITDRMFIATALGYGIVAFYAAIAIYLGWIDNPWKCFFCWKWAYRWIPVVLITLGIAGTWFILTYFAENRQKKY